MDRTANKKGTRNYILKLVVGADQRYSHLSKKKLIKMVCFTIRTIEHLFIAVM